MRDDLVAVGQHGGDGLAQPLVAAEKRLRGEGLRPAAVVAADVPADEAEFDLFNACLAEGAGDVADAVESDGDVVRQSRHARRGRDGSDRGCQVDLLIQTPRTAYAVEVKRKTKIGREVEVEMEERISRRACVLLRTTAMPLRAIAEECGFSSRPYLSLVFKKRFGKTPGEWRCQNTP